MAAKLLTPWLQSHMDIYCAATKPLWTWYTEQVERVKTPQDGLVYLVGVANGGWREHINKLLDVLTDDSLLRSVGLPLFGLPTVPSGDGLQEADVLRDFTFRLCGNRFFGMVQHDCPPLCYAGIFSTNQVVQRQAAASMKTHWAILTTLESFKARNETAAAITADVAELFPPAVRLCMMAFEADRFSHESRAGRKVLCTMLAGFPDTKSVEDTHQHLRDLQREGRSFVSSRVARARACYHSPVLGGRLSEPTACFRKLSSGCAFPIFKASNSRKE